MQMPRALVKARGIRTFLGCKGLLVLREHPGHSIRRHLYFLGAKVGAERQGGEAMTVCHIGQFMIGRRRPIAQLTVLIQCMSTNAVVNQDSQHHALRFNIACASISTLLSEEAERFGVLPRKRKL